MRTLAIGLAALVLAGCANDPPVRPTKPAAKWMMEEPKDLPDPHPDENAKKLYGEARKGYGDVKAQLKGLQAHVRARDGKK